MVTKLIWQYQQVLILLDPSFLSLPDPSHSPTRSTELSVYLIPPRLALILLLASQPATSPLGHTRSPQRITATPPTTQPPLPMALILLSTKPTPPLRSLLAQRRPSSTLGLPSTSPWSFPPRPSMLHLSQLVMLSSHLDQLSFRPLPSTNPTAPLHTHTPLLPLVSKPSPLRTPAMATTSSPAIRSWLPCLPLLWQPSVPTPFNAETLSLSLQPLILLTPILINQVPLISSTVQPSLLPYLDPLLLSSAENRSTPQPSTQAITPSISPSVLRLTTSPLATTGTAETTLHKPLPHNL